MTALSVVDTINRDTMRASVRDYAYGEELTSAETAALGSVLGLARNRRILDVGVGGGRTVRALRQISRDYVGVDYVPEMVAQCRRRFPFVRFDDVDARSMPQYADGSFDVVFFPMNGLCMVEHGDRLRILREVRRVLSVNGVFIFSTFNQASDGYDAWFSPPAFLPSRHPVQLAQNVARFGYYCGLRAINRMRFRKFENRGAEYSMINDQAHHYRTILYYVTLENQRKQLEVTGFRRDARVFDLSGNEVIGATRDDSMMFVARPNDGLPIVRA